MLLNCAISDFLIPSLDTIIVLVLILGYIWVSESIFFNTICLLLVNILCNFVFKVTFEVPLIVENYYQAFTFPSGLVQCAAILYAWAALKINNIIYKIILIFLLIVAGLISAYIEYCSYINILGTILLSSLILFIYSLIECSKSKILRLMTLTFGTLLVFYAWAIYGVTKHILISYCTIMALMLSEKIFLKEESANILENKSLISIICLAAFLIIKIIFNIKLISELPQYYVILQWFMIGFCIPAAIYISKKIELKSDN